MAELAPDARRCEMGQGGHVRKGRQGGSARTLPEATARERAASHQRSGGDKRGRAARLVPPLRHPAPAAAARGHGPGAGAGGAVEPAANRDRATAPIRNICCEKIPGCSYRQAALPIQCPLCADNAEKLWRTAAGRNFEIRRARVLNQSYALGLSPDSMLRSFFCK